MTRETVFIVDDDAAICEGLSNLLDSVGIETEQFASAEAFWESWNDARAGCMLLDARLPGASGVEFQEQLRRMGIGLPIIFMTAHGDIPMVRKVMKVNATFDHRFIDGAHAAVMARVLRAWIEHPFKHFDPV